MESFWSLALSLTGQYFGGERPGSGHHNFSAYITAPTGGAPDANLIPIPKPVADAS